MDKFTINHEVLSRRSEPNWEGKTFLIDYDHYQVIGPHGFAVFSGDGEEGEAQATIVANTHNAFIFRQQLEKAETERKQQDILITEMTAKIVMLQEELDGAKALLQNIANNAPQGVEMPKDPATYGFWLAGNFARGFLEKHK